MGSKASGEPSLLLTTSVLYAFRHAVQAARHQLQALQAEQTKRLLVSTDTKAVGDATPRASLPGQFQNAQWSVKGGGEGGIPSVDSPYFEFDAPASVVKLKQVWHLAAA